MDSLLRRRLDLWLPSYVLGTPRRAYERRRRAGQLTHIMFLVCDHFEPRHGIKEEGQAERRVRAWQEGYARLQERCQASFGSRPVHTWFYPPHHGMEHLPRLAEMVFDGLGEVELHYHHDGDTAERMRRDLDAALAEYHRWGLLLQSGETPRRAFGFIHGDWALGNSGGGRHCGVNEELDVLGELGCWGDFTMPSANECQTRKINSIYYAAGDARRPKSHDTGTDARVGRPDTPGLFLMQGPLGVNWHAPDYPRIENASLTTINWGRPDRIRAWLDCQIHVRGRPEWLFVKLHCHGAIEQDFDALFGDKAFEMHRRLNEEFNDGKRFRLHYVTARQAYNIAKAAEHGKSGDPSPWRDFVIKPQANSFYAADAAHDLLHCSDQRLAIAGIRADAEVRVRVKPGAVRGIRAPLSALELDRAAGRLQLQTRAGGGRVALEVGRGFSIGELDRGTVAGELPAADGRILELDVAERCSINYRETAA